MILSLLLKLHQFEVQFQALLVDMENRRSAHEVLLAQLQEGDFLEAGSVRSTLSGLSTASKRARFGAGRDLAEVERAQAEEGLGSRIGLPWKVRPKSPWTR